MSDLSSNSMSRQELIRNARANCLQQIDNPQKYAPAESRSSTAEKAPFKRGTYIRLFISCFILLAIVAVKQFNLSYQGYSFSTIAQVVEDNEDFEKLQQMAGKTIETDILPVFQKIKSIGK